MFSVAQDFNLRLGFDNTNLQKQPKITESLHYKLWTSGLAFTRQGGSDKRSSCIVGGVEGFGSLQVPQLYVSATVNHWSTPLRQCTRESKLNSPNCMMVRNSFKKTCSNLNQCVTLYNFIDLKEKEPQIKSLFLNHFLNILLPSPPVWPFPPPLPSSRFPPPPLQCPPSLLSVSRGILFQPVGCSLSCLRPNNETRSLTEQSGSDNKTQGEFLAFCLSAWNKWSRQGHWLTSGDSLSQIMLSFGGKLTLGAESATR